MWLKKNKWKIIVPVLIIAVLALAFVYGGNSPGSDEGGITDEESAGIISAEASDAPSEDDATPLPEETPDDETDETETASSETPGVEPTETSEDQNPEKSAEETPEATDDTSYVPYYVEEATQPTMEIDPNTGKDKYQTDLVPTGKPLPVEPQDVQIGTTAYTCTISISCATILNNMKLCDSEKISLVPQDGWILKPVQVTFYEGESVFNVLQRTCKQLKIHMEFQNTPMYNSAYIEGIANLYEMDVGDLSGWMYKVNDWFPNYGCSRYQLKDGDVIEWVYTCDLGADVGGRNVIDPIKKSG